MNSKWFGAQCFINTISSCDVILSLKIVFILDTVTTIVVCSG